MNRGIKAVQRNGVWHLAVLRAVTLEGADRERMRQSIARGQELNLENYRRLAGAGVWQLELVKANLDDGEVGMGLAADFAQRCVEAPGDVHTVRAPAVHLSRRSVLRALEARRQRVAGDRLQSLADRLHAGAAIAVAWLFWLGTLVRTLADNTHMPTDSRTLLAVHGEWTNRTRHVLGLAHAAGAAPVVLVLGRPRSSLERVARLWTAHGFAGAKLVRPFSALSALRSAGTALRLCAQGWTLLPRQPQKPRFGEQVAMAYRCVLGAACADWWKHSGATVAMVVYGHTGLADTTLLEEAQQASGATTIHAVHGISAGLNFVGHSSVGLFRCSHDARWHGQLGGYGACTAEPTVRPTLARGGQGILFLSNHLHPMNPWYRAFGPADELQALDHIAAAGDALGIQRDQVVWKPHPVFHSLPAEVQTAAIQHAQRLGFRAWLDATPLERASTFALVLTTRSTAALDVLRLGIVPVILESRTTGAIDALSRFPLQARDASELIEAASSLLAPVDLDRVHAQCWADVGPAGALRAEHCLHPAGA